MRVFIASLATETNTFAPFPTGRRAYEENGITKSASRTNAGYGAMGLRIFRERAEAAGYEVVEGLSAFAQPAGRTVKSVYEELRNDILTDLTAQGPFDIVLFLLHGAMVADGYDDCEGDILARARAIAPHAVIGAEFDPHLHLTAEILDAADAVTIFKEYPHTDIAERAHELFDICVATAQGQCAPIAAMVDTRMLGFYPTQDEPMKSIVAALHAAEAKPQILSASIAHGFPWGDVVDVGTRVLVYADGDGDAATSEAMDIAQRLYNARDALLPHYPDIPTSLDRAARLNGTIVLGDHSDNPGGGAPCDSTFFLHEMLKRGVADAVIGSFYDPSATQICADAGVGATLSLRLGGKIGPSSGDPIDLEVEVAAVQPNHDQDVFGARQPMGLAVWVKHGGIDILMNDVRGQVYGLDLFTGIGIKLKGRRLIVVKSSNHYVSAFAGIADHLWHVVSPGALSLDLAGVPLTKRDGDYHPRIADPWAIKGKPVPIMFSRERSA